MANVMKGLTMAEYYNKTPRAELLHELNECLKTVNAEMERAPGSSEVIKTQGELLLAIQREAKKNAAQN